MGLRGFHRRDVKQGRWAYGAQKYRQPCAWQCLMNMVSSIISACDVMRRSSCVATASSSALFCYPEASAYWSCAGAKHSSSPARTTILALIASESHVDCAFYLAKARKRSDPVRTYRHAVEKGLKRSRQLGFSRDSLEIDFFFAVHIRGGLWRSGYENGAARRRASRVRFCGPGTATCVSYNPVVDRVEPRSLACVLDEAARVMAALCIWARRAATRHVQYTCSTWACGTSPDCRTLREE